MPIDNQAAQIAALHAMMNQPQQIAQMVPPDPYWRNGKRYMGEGEMRPAYDASQYNTKGPRVSGPKGMGPENELKAAVELMKSGFMGQPGLPPPLGPRDVPNELTDKMDARNLSHVLRGVDSFGPGPRWATQPQTLGVDRPLPTLGR